MIYDIAFNAADRTYKAEDIDQIMARCKDHAVIPFLVGTDYDSSLRVLDLATKHNTYCYLGIHPNDAERCEHEIDKVIELIQNVRKVKSDGDSDCLKISNTLHNRGIIDDHDFTATFNHDTNKPIQFVDDTFKTNVLAVGEVGLDYSRSPHSAQAQKHVLHKFLDLCHPLYFLHSRHSHRDLLEILSDYKINGVVHSFDGTHDEAAEITKRGLFIGLNGASFKTQNNLDVVRDLELCNLLVESDAPYCRIGRSYAGFEYVKQHTRKMKYNEPVNTKQVIDVIAGIKDMDTSEVERILQENTERFIALGNKS